MYYVRMEYWNRKHLVFFKNAENEKLNKCEIIFFIIGKFCFTTFAIIFGVVIFKGNIRSFSSFLPRQMSFVICIILAVVSTSSSRFSWEHVPNTNRVGQNFSHIHNIFEAIKLITFICITFIFIIDINTI